MRKFWLIAGIVLAGIQPARAQGHWKAGVATIDITPQEPIWMAGYGNRTKPSEGVLQKLYVKALVLEDVAKEQVLLSLPMRAVCREDCKGLCPHCGINRNRETCDCQAAKVDPRWEALKKF